MSQKWLVVADRSRARIFSMTGPTTPLREIEDLLHPEGRQKARDLKSDRPPRLFRGRGEASHPVESKVGPNEQETIDFAKRIADYIEQARVQGESAPWVLIAPPDFLGALRAALSAPARKCVVQTLDKNLVQASESEIRAHLSSG